MTINQNQVCFEPEESDHPGVAPMPKRRNKAALIRALLAEKPNATAIEIVEKLAAQRVRVTPAHVYNVTSMASKPKMNGYQSLIQAKKLADALGGVKQARAAWMF
jgi:Arginine repressor